MSFPSDTALPCAVREAANREARQNDGPVDLLILHYTGMASQDEALDRLCAAESRVSCHYMVFEDGRIVQMVPERLRAWHAGVSSWRGETDINSRSIGVEIANPGHEFGYRAFPEAQMAAVTALAGDIVARRAIPARNVLAHSDVAPGRKQDPGEKFDWARLHRAGIGHLVEPEPLGEGTPAFSPGDEGAAVADFQRRLADYGYGIEASGRYDEATVAVVIAFQRHFRQARVDGMADYSTVETLRRLADPF